MFGLLLRAASLLAVYLLVLASIDPGDVLIGSLLALAIVAAGRGSGRTHGARAQGRADGGRTASGWLRWGVAVAGTLATTAWDVAVGTVRTVRFALGGKANPGFVEIPRAGRSRRAVALWGVLTGEAPDEYPVDVDEPNDVLLVHVLDRSDPEAIRARHARVHERWQRHVVS